MALLKDNGMFSPRTRFTLAILQYNFVVFGLTAIPTFYYSYYITRPSHIIDDSIIFDLCCAIALVVLLPGDGVSWLNVLSNLLPPKLDQYRKSDKIRTFERLLICVVSKGDNIEVC